MQSLASISYILITLSLIIQFPFCSKSPQAEATKQVNADWRWGNINDFGRSLNPGRTHVIEMYPGFYAPGTQPFGVGERLRAIRLLADEYEKLHAEVTIQFTPQLVVEGGSEGEAIRTKLLGGIAPEIVNINTEACWPDVEQKKGWWIPLDDFLNQPNRYVTGNHAWIDQFKNQALTQAKRAPDGLLYCITFDVVETGIFYNKTLFEKYGAQIPQNWQEFLQLQQTFADSGLIPLACDRAVFMDWAPDLLFDQCYYEILDLLDYQKKSPIEEAYYQGYFFPEELCWLAKKGWFSAENPRFREHWRLLKQWRRYWQKDLTHSDNQRLFITQRSPMFWTGSWFVRRMMLDPLITFDWGIFYPPPIHRSESPYCCGVDQCVIGGAGIQFHVTRRAIDDGDLEPTIDFLKFITTPEHASCIANEGGMFIANIVDAAMPPNLTPFSEIVLRRYCTVKWHYSLGHRFTDHRERMIEFFLNDGISLDDFMVEMSGYLKQTADQLIRENGWQEPTSVPQWSPEIEQEFLKQKEASLD